MRWRPALDLNRVILGGPLVGVIMLRTIHAIMTARPGVSRRAHEACGADVSVPQGDERPPYAEP